ncbi:MAG TPA: hypothetical protein ENH82_01585 [bacterium]|nr:hypothetical protein [bacterium]
MAFRSTWLRSLRDILVDGGDDRQKLVTMAFGHHKIHTEESFVAQVSNTVATADNSLTMYFKSPDSTIRIHLVPGVSADNEGDFELRESATVSLSGTVITIFNRDRNSSEVSTVLVRDTPTITASGTQLALTRIGSTGFKESAGGSSAGRREWLLKQGTVYLMRFTAENNDTEVTIEADWYEANRNE